MSTLSPTEKQYFEELFGMETGYIMENEGANITNAKFQSIINDATGMDVNDFRNYIHPFEEMKSGFTPNQETAKICLQVLRAAVVNLQGDSGRFIVEFVDS